MISNMPIDRNLLSAPLDLEMPRRADRLRMLGLGAQPDAEFDSVASRIADMAGAPYAMVNFVGEEGQYLAGLSEPTAAAGTLGRVVPLSHGYCPHVVVRRKALILGDVCDYPRFAGNPVVDGIGIRAYMGVPLIDEEADIALGTICAVATEARPWGRPELHTLKSMADEVLQLIQSRR